MLIVGLTGGIASGKSLVARVFQDLGGHIICADKIVHGLLEPGQRAWEEVRSHFGSRIENPDTTIDRRKLGEIVFNDDGERTWLNQCLHPKVFEVFTTQIRHLADREPAAIVILDAALLIETGYHKKMDKVVVVFADEEQQMKRLMDRDSFSSEQAMARIRSQMPLAEKKRYADYVIENTGNRADTETAARSVFEKLKAAAESKE